MKILVSLSPLAIQAILGIVVFNSPEFGEKSEIFFENILGYKHKKLLYGRNNIYMYICNINVFCLYAC